jgi:hypothetical protein
MPEVVREDPGLLQALLGDGRPLLLFTGLSLVLSGLFALFLGATGQFLPHDAAFLGMGARQLCALNQCRIVHFMIHDRVAFGGALVAVGALYLWLAEFPLRQRQAWAWWLLLVSGLVGFGSFLAYLGYGYLDTWHGVATLALLPCFGVGLARSFFTLAGPVHVRCLWRVAVAVPWRSRFGLGRACLLTTALGMTGGGMTILLVGMTAVFVPQDLGYLGLSPADLRAINPRLVPLIAHDRAGFGGGVCCAGIVLFFCVRCGRPCRSLWQVLAVVGAVGFGTAIGVHPAIGYNDVVHLAPAGLGAVLYLAGLLLLFQPLVSRSQGGPADRLEGLPVKREARRCTYRPPSPNPT